MAYTVLARKYRPQTFADLAGQDHVTRTIANAIAQGRVAHAFLFTGVRGVGKTTSARILAKALNCVNGPTAEPCNVCDQCKEITAGVDMDVLEMDGASNNSVDDVRRLQESMPYRPSRDRFKIVIVDEVHMLSTGAFNAFLKTLEEPPAHVKFIFATTESHKVPITIRSRCQRYDFRLIAQSVVAKRVREILTAENISADDAAVSIVAREAAGSMRDALTLLDQIIAYGGTDLRGVEVAKTLGLADRKRVLDMSRHLLAGEGAEVLQAVDALATQGLDMLHFTKQLLELVRDLVVLRVTNDADTALVDLVDEERNEARAIAESADILEIERVFAGISKLVDDVARSGMPRTVLEMGLVRIATRPPLRDLGELFARLEAMESGAPQQAASQQQRAPQRPSAAPSSPGTVAARQVPPASAKEAQPRTPTQEAAPARAREDIRPSQPAPAPRETAPAPSFNAAQSTPRPAASASASPDELWVELVEALRTPRPALSACLEHGAAQSISKERIVIVFPRGSFFGDQAQSPEAREHIAEAAAGILGAKPAVEVTFGNVGENTSKSIAQAEATRVKERQDAQKAEALSHPRVLEALEVFPEAKNRIDVNVDVD